MPLFALDTSIRIGLLLATLAGLAGLLALFPGVAARLWVIWLEGQASTTRRIRQRLCGLHGHDALLHFDNGRVSLLCYSCGHESPGWKASGVARSGGAR